MSFITATVNIIKASLLLRPSVLPGEAECREVTIKGNYVAFKTDCNEFKRNVLETVYNPGEARKISDYLVISENVILVCEMKSRNEGDMKKQLKNTGKFAKYILSMIKQHGNVMTPIPDLKYVCFAKAFSNKQQTKDFKLESVDWSEGKLFRLPCGSTYHLKQFE